jgi:branched-chain amino acid transport system substrate-binding protein
MISTTRIWRSAALMALAGLALAACGGSSSGSSSSGSGGGGGAKTLIISSDLPLQGASKDASASMNNAIKLILDQVGNKAGKYKVAFKSYDDSTAAKGAYDDATCAKNAQDHVANANEVAVMGTYNSGCAKLEVPVLNQDPNGPMLMVSHANTNPGLTKAWDPGEPDKYYPTGKRNYARVVTTDDFQGAADPNFIKSLGKQRCFVLNDNTTYGQGVATAFVTNAKKIGLTVLGNQPWDPKQPNYTALYQSIKAKNPDCVFLAGIFDLNGGQLIKDKVKVLGDNTKVLLMGPDGFVGYPANQKLKESEGMYLSFPAFDTSTLRKNGGGAAKFLDAYKAKYGTDPVSSYALYAASAVQVILAAIEKSDGTRKGVTDAVFTGAGITVPADVSVIGKEMVIDPKTGDTTNTVFSILQMKGGVETFVKAQAST